MAEEERSMKNVLVSCYSMPPDYSGAGLRAYRTASRLSAKHHIIGLTVGTTHQHDPFPVTRIRLVPEQGVWFPIHLIQAAIKANWLLFRHRKEIDVLHLFSFPWLHRLIALSNALIYKKPVILETTLDGFDDPRSLVTIGLRNRMFGWLTKFLLKKISILVAGSPQCRQSGLDIGIRKDRIILLPRPVNEQVFATIPISERLAIRKKLGIPRDTYVMMHVGRLQQRKNQLFLSDAAIAMSKEKTLLILIGPADEEKTYYRKLQSLSHTHKDMIRITGEQNNVNEYMIASDLLVFASENEGFPNVVAEALVSGLPVVTVELDPINSYINKDNGILVKNPDTFGPKTRAAFVQALKKARNTTFDREDIRNTSVGIFGSAQIDATYDRLYNTIRGTP
jgi:glycosyltransferase involved in cell wall biosynthesis